MKTSDTLHLSARQAVAVVLLAACVGVCLGVVVAPLFRSPPNEPALISMQSIYSSSKYDSETNEGSITLRLKNRASCPISISRVETNATCCVKAEAIVGVKFLAHEEKSLDIKVTKPTDTEGVHALRVFSSQNEVPIEVVIRRTNPKPLSQRIVSATPPVVYVMDGERGRDVAKMVVETLEMPKSAAWLAKVACDVPGLAANIAHVAAEDRGANLKRTYFIHFYWTEKPVDWLYSGNCVAESTASPSETLPLAAVQVALDVALDVAPRVVLLQPSKGLGEIVVFDRGRRRGKWRLDDVCKLPAWLKLDWQTDSAGLLRISAVSPNVAPKPSSASVSVINTDGRRDMLRVVFSPSIHPTTQQLPAPAASR